MNIAIFLFILVTLVVVHELGHFLIAKKSGVRVDEFGVGFPPRLYGRKIGETLYTVNLLPFGGFVRLFGEHPETDGAHTDMGRSLAHKKPLVQIAVLFGGVFFNILFAWLIMTVGLMSGLPTAVTDNNAQHISSAHLVVSSVLPNSPAEKVGIKAGDIVIALHDKKSALIDSLNPTTVSDFIMKSSGEITLSYMRGAKNGTLAVTATDSIVGGKQVIGIGMDMVGILRLPIHRALWDGAIETWHLTEAVAINIFHFISQAIIGQANMSEVAGPVGMVALVGDARSLGVGYLIFFAALLSINLAVINLIPIPALDGGRIVIVLIEWMKGSALKPKMMEWINIISFGGLILLMLVVMYHDIVRLF